MQRVCQVKIKVSALFPAVALPGFRAAWGTLGAARLAESLGLISGNHSLVLADLRALQILARNCSASNKSHTRGLPVYCVLGTLRHSCWSQYLLFAQRSAVCKDQV